MGTVPASFVSEITGGLYDKPWKAQVNKLLRDGGHDLIFSIGQVVPHEVIGMANYKQYKTIQETLMTADNRIYKAKDQGRNKIVFE